MTEKEFIRRYCEVFRHHAYATRDDSLNEFEKLITHVLNMLQYHQKLAGMLGMPSDPRDSVEAIEDALAALSDAQDKYKEALLRARGIKPESEG